MEARRAVLAAVVLLLTCCLQPGRVARAGEHSGPLLELLQAQTRAETPLYQFSGFEEGVDEATLSRGEAYFEENPGLLKSARQDLGAANVACKLDRSQHRLLFVPEQDHEYASRFRDYCWNVIHFVLAKTDLPNPYERIEILGSRSPQIPEQGLTVFLVNNLAEEHVCQYVISDPQRKSLLIELTSRNFSGMLGAYTSTLGFLRDGTPDFRMNHYMIWQTSAKNPYTLLSVPVEETLHALLRPFTHQGIRREILAWSVREGEAAQNLVRNWMEIEEAVVGGLVRALLPLYFDDEIPDSLVRQDLESKVAQSPYRFLERGIKTVQEMGYFQALQAYTRDPRAMRDLLSGR